MIVYLHHVFLINNILKSPVQDWRATLGFISSVKSLVNFYKFTFYPLVTFFFFKTKKEKERSQSGERKSRRACSLWPACVCLPAGPVNLSTSAQLVAPAAVVKGTLSITASELYFEVDEDEPSFKTIDPKVKKKGRESRDPLITSQTGTLKPCRAGV